MSIEDLAFNSIRDLLIYRYSGRDQRYLYFQFYKRSSDLSDRIYPDTFSLLDPFLPYWFSGHRRESSITDLRLNK